MRPELDLTGLELPAAALDEDDLPGAAVDDGGARHCENRAIADPGLESDICVHPDLEPAVGIANHDPDLARSGFLRHRRIDEVHRAGEGRAGIGVDLDLGPLTIALCPD